MGLFGGLGSLMSLGGADIVARVGLQGADKFNADMDKLSAKTAVAAKMLNTGLTIGILAAAGALVKCVSEASKFEEAMRNVNSISKLSEEQFAKQSKEVLELSKKFPQSATVLAKGLYDIASSGFKGADGLK